MSNSTPCLCQRCQYQNTPRSGLVCHTHRVSVSGLVSSTHYFQILPKNSKSQNTTPHSFYLFHLLKHFDYFVIKKNSLSLSKTNRTDYLKMTVTQFRTLVTTNWLRNEIFALASSKKRPTLRILDASAKPDPAVDGYREFYLQ